ALIVFDADYVGLHARSLLTLMLVVSAEPFTALTSDTGLVESGQPLLRLSPGDEASDAVVAQEGEARFSKPLTLPNLNGLHARPAAVFAQAAKGFSASICLHKQQASANAKSLVAIMALQTAQGDTLQVSAVGEDAELAIKTLAELLAAGCGETVVAVAMSEPVTLVEASSAKLLRGVCASPGSAFGQVVQVAEQTLEVVEAGSDQAEERRHLERALLQSAQALQR